MTSNELEIFKQSILDDVRVMMQTTGQVTQYIGARYVPLFAEPLDWSAESEYEPLTIVLDHGNSFTSRQFVPKGVDISDESFWANTGNYNAQIEQYRQEVQQLKNDVDKIRTDMKESDGLKLYGAVEGEDATAAITEMIEKRGFISLDGDYLITSVEVKDIPLIIFGNGHKLTSTGTGNVMFQGSTKTEQGKNDVIYIENCTFDGNMQSLTSEVVGKMAVSANRCSDLNVKNCNFINFAEDCLFIGGVENAYIANCNFKNVGTWLYQSTRNALSIFTWWLNSNGAKMKGAQNTSATIIGNTFTDITDEGMRIDDFSQASVSGNSFNNIGQYALEITYDKKTDSGDKSFVVENNAIDTTGSTPISVDLLGQYDQSGRELKLTVKGNKITGIGESTRYQKNGSPLAIKMHIAVNFFVVRGTCYLTIEDNYIESLGFTQVDATNHFYNYLFYVYKVDTMVVKNNTIKIGGSDTFTESYICCVNMKSGLLIFKSNNVIIDGGAWCVISTENNTIVDGNVINGDVLEYVVYGKTGNIFINENIIENSPKQHMLLFQNLKSASIIGNEITMSNNSSSKYIASFLGDVSNSRCIVMGNNFNGASHTLAPTTGFAGLVNDNNI